MAPPRKPGGPGGSRGRGDDKKGEGKQGQRRGLFRRRKVCKFCADKIDDINYKDVKLLSGFVPERAKVLPRRISGTCGSVVRAAVPTSSARGCATDTSRGVRSCSSSSVACIEASEWKRWRIRPSLSALAMATMLMPW